MNNEYTLPDDLVILSTADLQGNIVDFNAGFQEASGYTEAELIGKPHKLLRHPDMPKQAFEDFWRTIQAGLPWFGIVKNKRKNGDYYWVAANASPIIEKGKVTGYLSVRYPASATQKQAATELYAAVREGRQTFPWTKRPCVRMQWLKSWGAGLVVMALSLGLLVESGFSLLSWVMSLVLVAGAGFLSWRAWLGESLNPVLRQGVESIANGHFKEKIEALQFGALR